jgi:hypothetical protein
MTNEKDIREALRKLYLEKYPDSFIRDEYTHVTLSTRNDLFLVDNSCIISFEIKSNGDNLKKLRAQHTDYQTYSSEVVIAIDVKHFKKLCRDFLDLVENINTTVYVYNNNILEEYCIGQQKPFPNVFDLLWSSELLLFRQGIKRQSSKHFKSIYGKSHRDSKAIIKKLFTELEIFDISKYLFTKRIKENWPTDYFGYKVSNDDDTIIQLIEEKQVPFDNWSNEIKALHERD